MTAFNWDFPYTSQRMPLLAGNAVATSQPLAAQAGVRMMLKGGNAADAIVATAIARGADGLIVGNTSVDRKSVV